MQFYQLQMSLHHPQGAVDENSGAFAVDWNIWKVSLLAHFVLFTTNKTDITKFSACVHCLICIYTL